MPHTDEEIEEAARRFEVWADNLDPSTMRRVSDAERDAQLRKWGLSPEGPVETGAAVDGP